MRRARSRLAWPALAAVLVISTVVPAMAATTATAPGGSLQAVSASSARDVWGVGFSDTALIMHFNGHGWKQLHTAEDTLLEAVYAPPGRDAFAAGTGPSVLGRWNGTKWTWSPVASATEMAGINGTSASNVFAVGYSNHVNSEPLKDSKGIILHWNGTAWKQTITKPGLQLASVAVTSGTNAWAAGQRAHGKNEALPAILRWNGSAWSPASLPGTTNSFLDAVSASSVKSAFAAGGFNGSTGQPLVLRWNGSKWTRAAVQPLPKSFGGGHITGLTALSPTDAWAVGFNNDGEDPSSFIYHWNGKSWKLVKDPAPAFGAQLWAVTMTSAKDGYAVGDEIATSDGSVMILHWNGRSWSWIKNPR